MPQTGLAIEVEIDDKGVMDLLSATQARMRDMKPAFKNIGEYMVREREKLFKYERDPEGRPWQKLKVKTYHGLFKKRKRYTKKGALTKGFQRMLAGKKILTQDHHLRRTVYIAGSDQVVISPSKNAQDYAAIHQFGGEAGRGKKAKIPARPHLGFNDENQREFIEIIRDHLMSGGA
ncbi:MAG: phage virion morphogenesis protein [Desulfobacterales bacterium]|nr:phage virion morphogenesis protein [Desulfobacterales bacterium]